MKSGSVFVTGTDTNVGKTLVSGALLSLLAARGFSVVGMKPVAAGCAEGCLNEDVVCLRDHSSVLASLGQINPYSFDLPVAPHLAAQFSGVQIQISRLSACYQELRSQAEWTVVEGAGGLMVPLTERVSTVDWLCELKIPVILVVAMRLGCINHALLTQAVLQSRGLRLVGWVANVLDPDMLLLEQNVETLTRFIAAPLMGVVPYLSEPSVALVASYLNVDCLLDD